MKIFDRIIEDLTIMKKTLEGQYPNPKCPFCNKWERLIVVSQIIFLISIAIAGIILVKQTEHDLETQCCTQLKAVKEFFSQDDGLYLRGEIKNETSMDGISFIDLRMPTTTNK